MKYWRGYLVAGIIGLFSWLLIGFASSHSVLMDMVYPYVTRLFQSHLADWSGSVDYSVWEVLVGAGMILVIGTAILMVILKWNPIQWFGWVMAGVSLVFFLNTVIYGLNVYSSPISQDIRLQVSEYTLAELQDAAVYYRDQANTLADQVPRDENGILATNVTAMAQEGVNSYDNLVHEHSYSIFAGVNKPVKVLTDPEDYTDQGLTGTTVPLTGEAAVNPEVPGVGMPYAICHEMAHRMCIPLDRDADIAAFLACSNSEDVSFRYSAYVMAYRTCYQAMLGLASQEGQEAANQIQAGIHEKVYLDMVAYDRFVQDADQDYLSSLTGVYLEQAQTNEEEQEDPALRATLCDLLVSWHIQEVVLPMEEAQNQRFDPFDESQVDLSGIVNAKVPAGG